MERLLKLRTAGARAPRLFVGFGFAAVFGFSALFGLGLPAAAAATMKKGAPGSASAAGVSKPSRSTRIAAKPLAPTKPGRAPGRNAVARVSRTKLPHQRANAAQPAGARVAHDRTAVRRLVQLQSSQSDATTGSLAAAAAVTGSSTRAAARPGAVNAWLATLRWPAKTVKPIRPLRSTSSRMPDLRVYEPVVAEVGRSRDVDPALIELLDQLRTAVGKSDISPVAASLAPDLKVIECDSDATRPCPAPPSGGKRRSSPSLTAGLEPAQRLLQSVCCADMRPHDVPGRLRRDAVLDLLDGVIDGGNLGRKPDNPDVVCSPSQPIFDRDKALAMAAAADTEPGNLRFATTEIVVRQRPEADAPEAARIPARQLVPIVTDLPSPLPDGWSAVALAGGTLAYTQPQGLDDLASNDACFRKNSAGAWQIISIVRRHRWGGLG